MIVFDYRVDSDGSFFYADYDLIGLRSLLVDPPTLIYGLPGLLTTARVHPRTGESIGNQNNGAIPDNILVTVYGRPGHTYYRRGYGIYVGVLGAVDDYRCMGLRGQEDLIE